MKYEILNVAGAVINTIVADHDFAEQHYPGAWRLAAVQDAPVVTINETEWLLDHGPFTDRLGPLATFTIDTSADPAFVAIRSDFARRKWIDLKDPQVIATVNYLAGHPLPPFAVLTTALIIQAQADKILSTPVADKENRALRKLYFS